MAGKNQTAQTGFFLFFTFLTMGGFKAQAAQSAAWEKQISDIVWVAYNPPTANPNKGIEATPEAISKDLAVLRSAGFNGLVTYSTKGVLGNKLPSMAKSEGFQGLILGIWDPCNQDEITAAKTAASNPIVLAFCVGNEGLGKRYQFSHLSAVIEHLRSVTNKPVSTTEEIDDYSDENLLHLGDWVFPNAHPFFHNHLDPDDAVRWTKDAYDDLKRRSNRLVIFKEVGLPTAGDNQNILTESAQEQYYLGLAKTNVKFVYFEAFDQPWKTHLPVETHWGIFTSDRVPKRLAKQLSAEYSTLPSSDSENNVFYVYLDADSPKNHYKPTGYMGDCGDIQINEAWDQNTHSGETCIRIIYIAKGFGPNQCNYSPPCKWAGVYWLDPANNWGKDEMWKDRGFDLSGYNCLAFWAKADKECVIEFKVGGIDQTYGDSLRFGRTKNAKLTKNWQLIKIDLKDADLKHIIGGFCWVTNWDNNPNGATFYIDDIQFEKD